MRLTTLALLLIVCSAASPKPKNRPWQEGHLDEVTTVYMQRHPPKTASQGSATPDSDTARIPLTFHSRTSVYHAEETAVTPSHFGANDAASKVSLDRQVPASLVLPWATELPSEVRFAVEGNTLHYLDGKGQEHRAKLLSQAPIGP